ncbi:putative protein TPRXL [Frankliniella occidentalis]|uniref:Uncharacterized protein n=1 Tax=Frankliniella occidentalis TaxID=133901 RepID=A0A6J1RXC2_FRAOC|nr:putative protein TPRXL [Frankliniella occidentalis]
MRLRGGSVGSVTVIVAVLGILVGVCVEAAPNPDGLTEGLDEDDDGPAGGAEGKGFFEHIASAIQNAIGNKKPEEPPAPAGPQYPTTTEGPYTTTSEPYSTTEKPYTTTEEPYSTTGEPYTTTEESYSTTSTSTTSTTASYGSNEVECSSCPDGGYVFPDSGTTSSASSSSSSSSSSNSGYGSLNNSSSSAGDEDILGVDWEDVFGPSNQAEVDAAHA